MSTLLPLATLGALALVLLASGVVHLRRPQSLRLGLVAHGVLGRPATLAVSRLLGPTEVALAGLLVVGAVGGGWPARVGGLAATVLASAFGAYLVVTARRAGEAPVPCACGVGEAPVGPSSVARAAVMAVLGAVGAATAAPAFGASLGQLADGAVPPAASVTVAVAATLTLAVATALLPAARALPRDPVLGR